MLTEDVKSSGQKTTDQVVNGIAINEYPLLGTDSVIYSHIYVLCKMPSSFMHALFQGRVGGNEWQMCKANCNEFLNLNYCIYGDVSFHSI